MNEEISSREVQAMLQLRQSFKDRIGWPLVNPTARAIDVAAIEELPACKAILIKSVYRCFPRDPVPLFCDGGKDIEASEVANALRGRTWENVDGLNLVMHSDWLWELSPEQLHYYLPTYLKTYLEHWPTVFYPWPTKIDFSLAGFFDEFVRRMDPTEHIVSIRHLLNSDQKKCFSDFIIFFFELSVLANGETNEGQSLVALSELYDEGMRDRL